MHQQLKLHIKGLDNLSKIKLNLGENIIIEKQLENKF